jgi:predicted methyltransferase
MQEYSFKSVPGILLSPFSAHRLLELRGKGEVPVNVGLEDAIAEKSNDSLVIYHGAESYTVPGQALRRIIDSDRFLHVGSRGAYVVEYRENNYYKLKYLGEKIAPTLEINGVHMHNISRTTPLDDARLKVKLLGVERGDLVLDVCTGLGYTALQSLYRGATVVTVEKDIHVLKIAEHNPYSKDLSSVRILLGDAAQLVKQLPEETFTKVLHDPPVLSFAGELYSENFYRELFRVMDRGGVLFHYTGAPGKHRGIHIQRGVAERLRRAGFHVRKVIKEYGVLAIKP